MGKDNVWQTYSIDCWSYQELESNQSRWWNTNKTWNDPDDAIRLSLLSYRSEPDKRKRLFIADNFTLCNKECPSG